MSESFATGMSVPLMLVFSDVLLFISRIKLRKCPYFTRVVYPLISLLLCLDAQNLAMELEFGANSSNSAVWVALELRPRNDGQIPSRPRERTVSLGRFPTSQPRKGVESRIPLRQHERQKKELGLLRPPATGARPSPPGGGVSSSGKPRRPLFSHALLSPSPHLPISSLAERRRAPLTLERRQ
jgi:hypothetical protein